MIRPGPMCKIGVPGGSRKDEQSEDGIASVRMWGGYDFAEVRERHAFRAQRVSGAESEARCGTKIRELRFGQAPLFGSLQGEARSVGVPGGSRTHGLSLRRRTLYPTELRKQICDKIILHRRGDCNKNSERITDFWRSVGDAVLAATGNAIGIKTRMFSDGERRTQKKRLRISAEASSSAEFALFATCIRKTRLFHCCRDV